MMFQTSTSALTAPVMSNQFKLPESSQVWKKKCEELGLVSHDFHQRLKENVDKRIEECDNGLRQCKFEVERNTISARASSKWPSFARTFNSTFNWTSLTNFRKSIFDKLCVKKTALPKIDEHMTRVIEKASVPYPSQEILAELNGIPIARKDMQTLLRLNWLNDEIINFYLNLIVERSNSKKKFKPVYTFNTFFFTRLRESGHSSIRRWTRKVDIFKHSYLLVPVHLGNHWCLAFIDFDNRSISYFDSLGGNPNQCCDILLDYLREESIDKRKIEFDDENWRFINAYSGQSIPQQKNGSDCGVFACTYAEFLTRGADLEFSQEDMPYFRKKMIYEIVTKNLLEV